MLALDPRRVDPRTATCCSSSTTRAAIAREVIAEIEAEWTARLGPRRMHELRAILEELNGEL